MARTLTQWRDAILAWHHALAALLEFHRSTPLHSAYAPSSMETRSALRFERVGGEGACGRAERLAMRRVEPPPFRCSQHGVVMAMGPEG